MTTSRDTSLRARLGRVPVRWLLVAIMVAFTAIVLLVQLVPLAAYVADVERDRIVTGLERDAFTLAGRSEEALQSGDPTAVSELSAPVRAYSASSGARVVIVDSTGTAVVTSDGTDLGQDYTNRPEIAAALDGRVVTGERPSATIGSDLLFVAVPVRSGSDVLGAVRITYPATDVDDAVRNQLQGLLLVGLITLLAAAVIAVLLARIVTDPLRRLSGTAERIAGGDLTARVETSWVGELREVTESFNTMAGRVEALVEAQRGFAGDASHQLRTPLTALRLRLEAAQELADSDPAAAAEALEAMSSDVDRMQRLVDGLLTLARADRGEVATTTVDVGAVVAERVAAWQPLAEERQVRLTANVPEGVGLSAVSVPEGVGQILDNYLDNALEAAPAGSVIDVTVTVGENDVQVAVTDAGPGLSAAERERAFDRFWRGDQGRPGSGLGLAIVRALADASGASVSLDAASPEGLRAVVTLRRP